MIENRGRIAAVWGSWPQRPTGRRVAVALAVAAVVWDLLCKPGDTVSEVFGLALADRKTRGPLLFAAAVLTVHVVQIAVRAGQPQRQDLHLERFEVLRGLGWPA